VPSAEADSLCSTSGFPALTRWANECRRSAAGALLIAGALVIAAAFVIRLGVSSTEFRNRLLLRIVYRERRKSRIAC